MIHLPSARSRLAAKADQHKKNTRLNALSADPDRAHQHKSKIAKPQLSATINQQTEYRRFTMGSLHQGAVFTNETRVGHDFTSIGLRIQKK